MMKTKQVWKPSTISEAWTLADKFKEECCFVAGGTWLRTQWEADISEQPAQLVSLDEVPELQEKVESGNNRVVIGSLTRLSVIMKHPIVQKELPLLIKACVRIGAPSIRNQATLGGNILTKVGDTLPALMIYEAELTWFDGEGYKTESIDDWLRNSPQETRILVQISFPLLTVTNDYLQFYTKTGRRETFIPSQVTVAGFVSFNKMGEVTEARLCAGGGSALSVRLPETEKLFLTSSTRNLFPALMHQKIKSEFHPPSDVFASSEYKKRVAANLIVSQWFKRGSDIVAAK